MSQRKDSLYLFVLAVIGLAGILTLVALGKAIPGELWQAAALVLGGFVGIARQDTSGTPPSQNVSLAGAISPTVNGSNITPPAPAAPSFAEGLAQDVPA